MQLRHNSNLNSIVMVKVTSRSYCSLSGGASSNYCTQNIDISLLRPLQGSMDVDDGVVLAGQEHLVPILS